MYCTKCGSKLFENTAVCPNCGALQGQQAYNNTNGYNQFQRNQMDPVSEKKFKNMLIFTIIEMVCCNQIFGAISLILIIFGKNAYLQGNFEKFEKNYNVALIILIVGVVLSLVCGIFYAGFSYLSIIF